MTAHRRSVLITGCSAGGIGHALAREFHSKGLQVIATARHAESMSELEALGVTTMELDVTDIEAIRRVRDAVAERQGGKLGILVNNAGQSYPVAITDMKLSDVRSIFEVNLFAQIAMVQEFLPLLIASGNGCVIQTGSISGIMPVPFSAAYNTSKAALHSFGDTLRVELAPFNVKVINVITGAVKSNIAKPRTIPEGSMYKAMEDLYQERRINRSQMNAVPTDVYACQVVAETLKANPRARLWAGKSSGICWFIDAFLPRWVFDSLMTRMFGLNIFAQRLRDGHKTD